jgi:hypothetical protein
MKSAISDKDFERRLPAGAGDPELREDLGG